jgi:hypothetical protein
MRYDSAHWGTASGTGLPQASTYEAGEVEAVPVSVIRPICVNASRSPVNVVDMATIYESSRGRRIRSLISLLVVVPLTGLVLLGIVALRPRLDAVSNAKRMEAHLRQTEVFIEFSDKGSARSRRLDSFRFWRQPRSLSTLAVGSFAGLPKWFKSIDVVRSLPTCQWP